MAPVQHVSGLLRPGEEDWQGVFERLCERFPSYTPERILGILRENNGHAGQAAAALRDLSGTAMRPVDPDDAEHVRTLLSSPVMFGHACKEQFRKHDINGDGVLEWTEILALTNSLYENFGLEPPREGGLKAFFEATDTNHDGVLSEKEFKRFFECFLRYAFFDVMNHQAQLPQAEQLDEEEEPASQPAPARPSASPQRQRLQVRGSPKGEEKPARSKPDGSPVGAEARGPSAAALDLDEPPVEGKGKPRRRHEDKSPAPFTQAICGPGAVLRCVAGHGVTYRKSADYGDRADSMAQKGEEVQVLEHWVRTSKGWLPLADKNGQVTFEIAQEAPASRAASDVERKSRSHKSGSSTGASRRPKAGSTAATEDGRDADAGSRRLSRSETAAANFAGGAPRSERPGSRDPGEPAAQPAAGGGSQATSRPAEPPKSLQPEEEEWRPRWLRLQERFPTASPEEAAQALRDHNGHAGQAASALRALSSHF